MPNNPSEKVQIKEIAERLGLSQSTVSVVLGGKADKLRISKETQKRVTETARELNYQPNIYARRLRQSAGEEAPYVIALFWRLDNMNSRLGKIIQGLQSGIEKRGRKVELILQPFHPGDFMQYREMLSGNRISAAIIGGLLEEEQKELEGLDFTVPIVLIGRDSERFHCVTLDNFKTGIDSLQVLLKDREMRSGAVISFNRGSNAQKLMEAGFLYGCKERGIHTREDWNVSIESSSYISGYDAAKQLFDKVELPVACMVADFRLAGGIMEYCNEKGIRVPEDFLPIFFEDSGLLRYNKPPLSSVDVPASDMAEKALDILITVLEQQITVNIKRDAKPLFYIR